MLNAQQFMIDFPYKSKCTIEPKCFPPFTKFGKTKEDIYKSWAHDINLMLLINEPTQRKMHVNLLNDISSAIKSGIICIYHLSYADKITHQYMITIEETNLQDIEKETTCTYDDDGCSIVRDYTFIGKYGNCAIYNEEIHFDHNEDYTAYITAGGEYMYKEDLMRALMHLHLKKKYINEVRTKISQNENMVLTKEYFTLSDDIYDRSVRVIFK